jgi:hypothetical protein
MPLNQEDIPTIIADLQAIRAAEERIRLELDKIHNKCDEILNDIRD